jgi:hypothetical protein
VLSKFKYVWVAISYCSVRFWMIIVIIIVMGSWNCKLECRLGMILQKLLKYYMFIKLFVEMFKFRYVWVANRCWSVMFLIVACSLWCVFENTNSNVVQLWVAKNCWSIIFIKLSFIDMFKFKHIRVPIFLLTIFIFLMFLWTSSWHILESRDFLIMFRWCKWY